MTVEFLDEVENSTSGEISLGLPMGVNLFLVGTPNAESLPQEIVSNPTLREQAGQRRELVGKLENIFTKIPDVHTDIEDAMGLGVVGEDEVSEVFEGLSDFIQTDENNQRILLYLPTQFLPDMGKTTKQSERLALAKQNFAGTIRNSWLRLIHERDVRAAFTDGDVLEPGMGTPPRVRKAAHLIPDLLDRGILRAEEISEILGLDIDEELSASLIEGILAAKGRGLVSPREEETEEPSSFPEVMERLDEELKTIDGRLSDSDRFSALRMKWRKGVLREEILDRAANSLARNVIRGQTDVSELLDYGKNHNWEGSASLAVIKAVLKAIGSSSLSIADLQITEDIVREGWREGSDEVRDELVGGINILKRVGKVSAGFLDELGISEHDLSALVPLFTDTLSERDMEKFSEIVKLMAQDPYLSSKVFPALILFGSRIKGYSGLNADFDGAIVMRPSAKYEERREIFQRLYRVALFSGDISKLLEFWAEQSEGKYELRERPEGEEKILGEQEIHILTGGIWIGKREDYKKVYSDILMGYLDLSRFGDQREEVRRQMLGQIELDVLQFRILHKGFYKYYPNLRGESFPNSELIDWESAFWDPGFRRVATKLFLERVFLPDLS